jgi:hypothetical protein
MRTGVAGAMLASLLAGCSAGSGSPDPLTEPPSATMSSLRVDPPILTADLPIGTSSTLSVRAFAASGDGAEIDVTGDVAWSIAGAAVASLSGPGLVTTAGVGGKATVVATLGVKSASAPLIVKLTGDVFLDGIDPASRARFAAAVDPTASIAVEYPGSGVVVPANLAPPEIQWTQVGTDALFRLNVSSQGVLDLNLYTLHRELAVPADVWTKIGASAPDAPIALAVDGLDGAGHRHASASVSVTITSDAIGQGGLYAHDCTHGGLVVIDFLRGTETRLATDSPSNLSSSVGHCAGCHEVSRDGRRMGFTRIETMLFGALRYDPTRSLFTESVPPGGAGEVLDVAFNPLEATTRPAMLSAFEIRSQGASGLWLLNPDTGATVPSDLQQMLAAVPPSVGRGATIPAWSSSGGFVVFSASPSSGLGGSQPTQGCAQCSLVEAPVAFGAGSFHFGTPVVVVEAAPGESNYRAALDDEDDAIVFMRATQVGPTMVESTGLYSRSQRREVPIRAGRADPQGGWVNLAPDWGPSGARHAWIVVPSNRPYGHEMTSPGIYQLWAFAVDRAKLASGSQDPSASPFWLAGQRVDESHTHPQWPRWMPTLP